MSEQPIREDSQPTPAYYPPPPQKTGGGGCWLSAAVTLFVVMVLVIIGLFLPPINLYDRLFGESYVALDATNNALIVEGLTFAVSPEDPGQGFGVNIESVSLRDFQVVDAAAVPWVPELRSAIPAYTALQSAVYSIETTGSAPAAVTLSLGQPSNVGNTDLLDLYGWYSEARRWRFIPSQEAGGQIVATVQDLPDHVALFQAAPPPPTVVVAYDVSQVLSSEAGTVATIVVPGGLQPTTTGALTGSLAPGFNTTAGYLVMPALRNYADPRALALDPETVAAILNNSAVRNEHVRQITLSIAGSGFDGVFIDYRGLDPALRDNFTLFIQALRQSFDQMGLRLGVVVPAAESVDGVWQTGAYDWRAIGAAAHYVQINTGLNPAAFSPGRTQPVEAMLRWAVGEISRYKILLGISARSVREIAGAYTSIGYNEALAGLGDVVIEAETSETGSIVPGTEIRASLDGMRAASGVDTLINAPFVEYLNTAGDVTARVWLTTGDALRFRMDRSVPFALAGVAFEDLLAADLSRDIFSTIISYKSRVPGAPAPTDLALEWRIMGSDGLVDTITTGLNESIVLTLAAPDGNYAINVAVVGIGQQPLESAREGATIALFQATATPTPPPTPTPTMTPTVTPTPAPIVATAAPVAAAPAGGSIVMSGGFEYGGHVTSASSARAITAMRQAGMTWMKVQIRYTPGAGTEGAQQAISAAHSNGFKILIGTVGYPRDMEAMGSGYIRDYVNWLGGIAASGPDAIEVWNEPNIDREWPQGQISGASYVDMLRQAYQAIKAANPSVMVISAAPAPTGAEAAFPGRVKNDNNWISEVVAAGGLQYMDCFGAHYNEGIVPPSANSGDPRGDNYYTRYFGTLLNTYWNLIGGQRPICFTELGYLTPEGYGTLPDFFAWASNVTVAQQAAWLAEAAALSSQSGRVRLMIVWNVDFQNYGADPQAGYAMIRPDGSCPACAAMAGAR